MTELELCRKRERKAERRRYVLSSRNRFHAYSPPKPRIVISGKKKPSLFERIIKWLKDTLRSRFTAGSFPQALRNSRQDLIPERISVLPASAVVKR